MDFDKLNRAVKFGADHTHADFHRRIAENPEDATPGLVYADWLEEQGLSHHAEVVRRNGAEYGDSGVLGAGIHQLTPHEGQAWVRINPHGYDAWSSKEFADSYTLQLHINNGLYGEQIIPHHKEIGHTSFAAPKLSPEEAYRLMNGLYAEGAGLESEWGVDLLRKHAKRLGLSE